MSRDWVLMVNPDILTKVSTRRITTYLFVIESGNAIHIELTRVYYCQLLCE
jgi:hypothetical protein